MPKLPNFEARWVPDAKIRDYVLDPAHEAGGPKHDFLVRYGFSRAGWPVLQAALMDHPGAVGSIVTLARVDIWGQTYRVLGPLTSPDGRNPVVRSYWLIRYTDSRPQFTSLKPRER